MTGFCAFTWSIVSLYILNWFLFFIYMKRKFRYQLFRSRDARNSIAARILPFGVVRRDVILKSWHFSFQIRRSRSCRARHTGEGKLCCSFFLFSFSHFCSCVLRHVAGVKFWLVGNSLCVVLRICHCALNFFYFYVFPLGFLHAAPFRKIDHRFCVLEKPVMSSLPLFTVAVFSPPLYLGRSHFSVVKKRYIHVRMYLPSVHCRHTAITFTVGLAWRDTIVNRWRSYVRMSGVAPAFCRFEGCSKLYIMTRGALWRVESAYHCNIYVMFMWLVLEYVTFHDAFPTRVNPLACCR